MGPYMNLKYFGDTAQPDCSGGKPGGNNPLLRQSSIYSLTFDEFHNTLGGPGKDFGSMNMEDLLKRIWTAEESQVVTSFTTGGDGSVTAGNLQRQGSLTLPRTLSQKAVDEVWRDVLKETTGGESGGGSEDSNMGSRQTTLAEMTLEEFLSLAGVVREDTQPSGRLNVTDFYGGLPAASGNNSAVTIGFQQASRARGLLGDQLGEQNNIVLSSSNLGINMSGVTSSQQHPQQSQPQLQPLFPKQTTLAFSSPTQLGIKTQLSSPVTEGPVVEVKNALSNTRLQGGAIVMGGLNNRAAVAGGTSGNHSYPDAIIRNSTDSLSLPPPYNFGKSGRGRRSSSSLEKVVERRRRITIKNRESAARSRARKQAYTLELEAEVAKLREKNNELRKKLEEFVEMQKNQIMETMNKPWGDKRRCLRRTLTGPW